MFWNRTTTTTTASANSQNGLQATPIVESVPVASVDAAAINAPTYNPPYEAVVPVPVASVDAASINAPTYNPPYEAVVPVPRPVASVTAVGMANVATADRTYRPDVRRSYNLTKIGQFVWLVAGALETLFAARIILKLIVANQAAGFAQFISTITAPFLAPFAGLMTNTTASNGSVLEITTIIAMLVYALLAWGIVKLLWIVFERRVTR